MATEGFTNASGSKVDLCTIIKRRKRTVVDFLNEKNVKTLADYESLVKVLENEFVLTDEFTFAALDFLVSMKVSPQPETNIDTSEEEKQEVVSSLEDEKKSKRRTKKEI